jgi:hypothetical protein
MAQTITIHCRQVVAGSIEGEALVSKEGIAGYRSMNDEGYVLERGHCLQGQTVKDKILVFPMAKGSSGWSNNFHTLALKGNAPRAMLINIINAKSALGAVLVNCPTVTDFDIDPLDVIQTGDWVKVDADAGVVTVIKKQG